MPARRVENLIYISVWIVVFTLYMLDMIRIRSLESQPPATGEILLRMVKGMVPFLVLFLVHNSVLIRKCLLANKIKLYLFLTIGTILIVWGAQIMDFTMHNIHHMEPSRGHMPMLRHPRPLLPMPVMLDLIYDLLIVGANLAVALIFQRFADRLANEQLQKATAENQLAYLKAQINPHFYMNMLNNIHGMIEINAVKAQQMVIDMSGLMRYMLYDSSNERIALSAEIAFMRNYLNLMRERYPEEKVKITVNLPGEEDSRGIMVPPLLFLVFIENSFKHGISYRDESFVSVSIELSGGRIIFNCLNSSHPSGGKQPEEAHGIGLQNVERRLRLIYGEEGELELRNESGIYIAKLSLPAHETQNHSN